MASRYNDIARPTAGTCDWLLHHESYQTWIHNRGLLWIEGKPGSGKSTLLRHALDHRKRQQRAGFLLSHFFDARGVTLQHTPLGLYRALLFQLLTQAPQSAPPELINAFNQQPKLAPGETQGWAWTAAELRRYFMSALPRALAKAPVTIYVDAVDEVGQEATRRLVEDFKILIQQTPPALRPRLGICFTSRHHPVIKVDKAHTITFEQENQGDIATYAQKRLSQVQDLHARAELLRAILEQHSGVFLWVSLVTDLVLRLDMEGIGLDRILKRLKAVPDPLFHFYNQLIRSAPHKLETLKLMQCLVGSMRPLSLGELRWAMVIDPNRTCPNKTLQQSQDASDWPGDPERLQRRVRTISCGLAEVVVRPQGRTVQFIHQSIKDFFVHPKGGLDTLENLAVELPFHSYPDPLGRAHHNMSRTCIRYFLMSEITRINTTAPSHLFKQQFNNFSFLRYALEFCFEHVRQAEQRGTPQDDLLAYFNWPNSSLPIRTWARLCSIDHTGSDKITFLTKPASAKSGLVPLPYKTAKTQSHPYFILLVLARAGIEGPFVQVFSKMYSHSSSSHYSISQTEPRDDLGNTPLITAAATGHISNILDRFLPQPWESPLENVDINATNIYGRRAIHEAAMHGREAVVKLLLRHRHEQREHERSAANANANAKTKTKTKTQTRSPEGQVHGVEMDITSPCKRGVPPFLYALVNGHESTLNLFLSDGLAGMNGNKFDILGWRNARGQNVLMLCAERGFRRSMEIIRRMDMGRRGVNLIKVECWMGRTALWYAMKGRNGEAFRSVFEIGRGDVEALMGSGRRRVNQQ
ncbi:hypothetical protein QBC44DRAFT_376087 [Cladorrhinum sp. PSN332]|nr:hypothetical protein QBC44DRAFT_376087 [Cladorrhinum sp. PSN332]